MFPKDKDDDALLTVNETSEVLGISLATLARWRKVGGIGPTYYKMGGSVRYRLGDLKEWFASTRVEGE